MQDEVGCALSWEYLEKLLGVEVKRALTGGDGLCRRSLLDCFTKTFLLFLLISS